MTIENVVALNDGILLPPPIKTTTTDELSIPPEMGFDLIMLTHRSVQGWLQENPDHIAISFPTECILTTRSGIHCMLQDLTNYYIPPDWPIQHLARRKKLIRDGDPHTIVRLALLFPSYFFANNLQPLLFPYPETTRRYRVQCTREEVQNARTGVLCERIIWPLVEQTLPISRLVECVV